MWWEDAITVVVTCLAMISLTTALASAFHLIERSAGESAGGVG